jgi:hypothetical protein
MKQNKETKQGTKDETRQREREDETKARNKDGCDLFTRRALLALPSRARCPRFLLLFGVEYLQTTFPTTPQPAHPACPACSQPSIA